MWDMDMGLLSEFLVMYPSVSYGCALLLPCLLDFRTKYSFIPLLGSPFGISGKDSPQSKGILLSCPPCFLASCAAARLLGTLIPQQSPQPTLC
jgi:hypothetical protein